MDTVAYDWYNLKFRNAVLEKDGDEYQGFFSDIMEKCYPGDFQRIRPWGNVGDEKNDGYWRSNHTVFQVYAPNEMKAADAIAKIEEDFYGALEHWAEWMDSWVFVHNSRKGLGPGIEKKLLELDAAHSTVKICWWGPEELRKHAFALNEPELALLLGGFAPTGNHIINIRYEHVQEVLKNIAQQEPPLSQDIRPVPPDKLQHNRLSESVQQLLAVGMWKTDLVKNFFQDHFNPLYEAQIAAAFSQEYKKLRELEPEPDMIFQKLQHFTGGQDTGTPIYSAAVLAVLAYFFEQCDVFERPPAGAIL
jgi:hypothetical protein